MRHKIRCPGKKVRANSDVERDANGIAKLTDTDESGDNTGRDEGGKVGNPWSSGGSLTAFVIQLE